MSKPLDIPSLQGQVSDAEWRLRVDLAACYRLVARYGWSDLIFTHISAKLPGDGASDEDHEFLINPYGLLFDEITASSLVKIDAQGRKRQDTPFPVNPAGFVIHSAVHAARPDAQCVLHTHTRAGVAVSAQREGLLPISQQSSFVLGSLAYHDYEGVAFRPDEGPRLQADLGDKSYLCLRNHGLLTVGRSIPEAFLAMYIFESACQIQIGAQAGGGTLTRIPEAVIRGTGEAMRVQSAGASGGPGALAWPALLRDLDRRNPGYDQ